MNYEKELIDVWEAIVKINKVLGNMTEITHLQRKLITYLLSKVDEVIK